MYDEFRTRLLVELSKEFQTEEIGRILKAVDIVAAGFTFSEPKNELATYDDSREAALTTYLMVKKMEGLSDLTVKNYGYAIRNFFNKCPKMLDAVTANDVRVYLYAYKAERNCSDRSLDKVREYIARFFHWLKQEDYITKDACASLKPIKHETTERKFMTQDELESVREACRNEREKAIVEILYSTGCRISELAILKKEDIDLNNGEVHLFGKGKKHRTSYLNAKAIHAIKNYMEVRSDDSEYLIVSEIQPIKNVSKNALEYTVKQITKRAGCEWVTPHIFRHSTATQAISSGMPVQEVQKLLGHEKIDTTMIYAKVVDESVKTSHKKYIV